MTRILRSRWDLLAPRIRATGALASVEDPTTILRIGTVGLLGSSISTVAFAGVFLAFGESAAALATLGLSAAFALIWLSWWYGPAAGSVRPVIIGMVVASFLNHIAVHIALGGFANSGGYMVFGIGVVLTATLALPRLPVALITGVYVVVVVALGLLESTLAAGRAAPDPALTTTLFVIVFATNLLLLVVVFGYLLGRLAFEQKRSEGLLLNVLPAKVAAELKRRGETTARRYDSISVLFADIVGFTPMSMEMDAEEMVAELNRVFTFFDSLVGGHGCEKIRTMGDNYMVACGVPTPRPDHAHALARMALDMIEFSRDGRFQFRIGINSGPAVAGVIGSKKFQYDVWGDTVNTASRMESHGLPGRIQITGATYELIKDRYRCTRRGEIEVKGKGNLETWFLEGPLDIGVDPRPRSEAPPPAARDH